MCDISLLAFDSELMAERGVGIAIELVSCYEIDI